jgi:hypothetical protein
VQRLSAILSSEPASKEIFIMNKILWIFIALCLPVLILSCEKEEKYNTIEGTLSSGMDMSPTSLGSIPLVLAKIYDTVDFNQASLSAGSFEGYTSTLTDANGFYHFDSLPDGNYLVACGEGFKFVDVDYAKIPATKGSTYQVNKTVNRLASANGPDIYQVEVKNESICKINWIEFFVNGQLQLSRNIIVEPGETNTQYGHFEFLLDDTQNPEFQLSAVRNDSVFTTQKVSFFGQAILASTEVELTRYNYLIGKDIYVKKIMMMKGWWFGHFIFVYPHTSHRSGFN